MKRYTGIVLKKFFSKSRKIALFDKQYGRWECIPNTENICLGAIVQYEKKNHASAIIADVEHIYLPVMLAQTDILFLHHILELCYYFLPVGISAPEIFHLIEFIYAYQKPLSNKEKKLFLIKFFTLIGIYPDDSKFQSVPFYQLIAEPIDIIMNQSLDLMNEQFLNQWLLGCVCVHPDVDNFKTMRFLDIHRTV